MSSAEFKAKAYVKEGCPFSFKFLVFMAEAGLLDRIEIVRMKPQDPGFEAEKEKLSKRIGKALTFPTVEVEPGQYGEERVGSIAGRELPGEPRRLCRSCSAAC
jgi:hypothetical protein